MTSVSTPLPSDLLAGLTLRFATHVANLTYEQIPDEVTTKAKLILRDGIGNEIAASAISDSRWLRNGEALRKARSSVMG
jgi:hypothetical protein